MVGFACRPHKKHMSLVIYNHMIILLEIDVSMFLKWADNLMKLKLMIFMVILGDSSSSLAPISTIFGIFDGETCFLTNSCGVFNF